MQYDKTLEYFPLNREFFRDERVLKFNAFSKSDIGFYLQLICLSLDNMGEIQIRSTYANGTITGIVNQLQFDLFAFGRSIDRTDINENLSCLINCRLLDYNGERSSLIVIQVKEALRNEEYRKQNLISD